MNDSELLALLMGARTTPIHVCRIKQEHAALIGAHTTTVWLSRDTVAKQEAKHASAQHDLYALAPNIIEGGFARVSPPKKLLFIRHITTDKLRSYKVTVKATEDGRELYLVSIHRLRHGDVRAAYKRSLSVEEWVARRKVGPPRNPT